MRENQIVSEENKLLLMAMDSERSKPLHNFSLPCLKWGNQRFLRCVKVPPNASAEPSSLDRRSSRLQSKFNQPLQKPVNPPRFCMTRFCMTLPQNPLHNSKRKSPPGNSQKAIGDENNNNIEAVREKIMVDLRETAKKLKVSILKEGDRDDEVAANARPWNLRTRRAACKAPNEEDKNCDVAPSPIKVNEATATKEKPVGVEKNERIKFSVSLSKEEVEEDFKAMVGTKPPRRPKRRPKIVRRQLDSLFPGLWLAEVTPQSYKVADVAE